MKITLILAAITKFTRNSLEVSFFPGDFVGAISLENHKHFSRGATFTIILFQRVTSRPKLLQKGPLQKKCFVEQLILQKNNHFTR